LSVTMLNNFNRPTVRVANFLELRATITTVHPNFNQLSITGQGAGLWQVSRPSLFVAPPPPKKAPPPPGLDRAVPQNVAFNAFDMFGTILTLITTSFTCLDALATGGSGGRLRFYQLVLATFDLRASSILARCHYVPAFESGNRQTICHLGKSWSKLRHWQPVRVR